MKKLLFLLIAFIGITVSAQVQNYTWEADTGTTEYTQDIDFKKSDPVSIQIETMFVTGDSITVYIYKRNWERLTWMLCPSGVPIVIDNDTAHFFVESTITSPQYRIRVTKGANFAGTVVFSVAQLNDKIR
jgi:hypothetical protein